MTSNKTLRDTEEFLSSISKKKNTNEPSYIDIVYYVLAKEFGLSIKDICELPIPYIVSLLSTHHYVKELEEKELSKSQKRKNGK
jgi:hypothetical protein